MPGPPMDQSGLVKLQNKSDTINSRNTEEEEEEESARHQEPAPLTETRQLTQVDKLNKRLLVALLERMNNCSEEFERFMDKDEKTTSSDHDDEVLSDEQEQDAAADNETKRRVDPTSRRAGPRRTRPKLDVARLRGPKGLHTVERYFEGLKFMGKGGEKVYLEGVVKRLEYWAHRLFPKYRLDDFLEKVETLGGKKEAQVLIKRCRLGLVADDDVVASTDEEEKRGSEREEVNVDPFDALINVDKPDSAEERLDDNVRESSGFAKAPEITDEIKARIEANRKSALERKLKRERERAEKSAKNLQAAAILSENYLELSQNHLDSSENHLEASRKNAIEIKLERERERSVKSAKNLQAAAISSENHLESSENHLGLSENHLEANRKKDLQVAAMSSKNHLESSENHLESSDNHLGLSENHLEASRENALQIKLARESERSEKSAKTLQASATSSENHLELSESHLELSENHLELSENHLEANRKNTLKRKLAQEREESENSRVAATSSENHLESSGNHLEANRKNSLQRNLQVAATSSENYLELSENHLELSENHLELSENHLELSENHLKANRSAALQRISDAAKNLQDAATSSEDHLASSENHLELSENDLESSKNHLTIISKITNESDDTESEKRKRRRLDDGAGPEEDSSSVNQKEIEREHSVTNLSNSMEIEETSALRTEETLRRTQRNVDTPKDARRSLEKASKDSERLLSRDELLKAIDGAMEEIIGEGN